MTEFVSRYSAKVTGVLSGFDRIVFRGTLRQLAHRSGLESFLSYKHVLLKEFAAYAEAITQKIRAQTAQLAAASGRPVRYLPSSQLRKEEVALDILKRAPVDSGLICVLSCVEPCMSYEVHRNRNTKLLELQPGIRKCLHLYSYFLDPQWGFMHARLQTWFPFTVQICLNGREWLARQMDSAGITYRRRDNCFVAIDDVVAAQRLMDQQLRTNWPRLLDRIRQRIHPLHSQLFKDAILPYYWSVHQMEWATDVMFDRPASLAAIYPQLTRHAITQFSSAEVMRFLGRKLHGNFAGELTTDYRRRIEGLRVKHRVNRNSVKIYDKQGSVLRVETTINHPRDLKVYRRKEGAPKSPLAWRKLRKGVAGIYRLAEVSQAANTRYLDALAHLEDRTPLRSVVDAVCRPTTFKRRRVRALRPWAEPDTPLLQAINRGEFVLTGFRNRDLRALLYPQAMSPGDQKRAAARVTRLLTMLRAHKLIRKIPKTHRYQLTKSGRQIVTAILAARDTEISTLLKAAA
jgi:hypothetical protein